jgi:hypothetical protein
MARHALIHRTDDVLDRDTAPAEERPAEPATVAAEPDVTPRDAYGGTNWGACFFGWLVAVGLTALLVAVALAAVTAAGASARWTLDDAQAHARGLGLGAAIAVTVIAFVGYYAGGYVAGRMSRFDGVRQGLGVWLIGVLTTAIAVGFTALLDARTDLFADVDRTPGDLTAGDVTLGATATGVAVLVVMLLAAVLGSAMGRRYHRRIDAVVVRL